MAASDVRSMTLKVLVTGALLSSASFVLMEPFALKKLRNVAGFSSSSSSSSSPSSSSSRAAAAAVVDIFPCYLHFFVGPRGKCCPEEVEECLFFPYK